MITANDLKKHGVSAVKEALQDGDEVMISVRGKAQYVALSAERYRELLDQELELAVRQAEEDYAEGRVRKESAAEHIKRLGL